MADGRDDNEIFWVEPRERAIVPLDGFRCSRSLRKTIAKDIFEVRMDTAFAQVITACAQPRTEADDTSGGSWISHQIEDSYIALHAAGHAHSIECWQEGTLIGGLYGVCFDKVFCGESMFSRASNASKVALAWLVAIMRHAGFSLLDCQFMTPHLKTMGATALPQADYLELLRDARGIPEQSLMAAYESLSSEGADSPGKRIAQDFTQTS